jgi:hypothetical protein
MTREELHSTPGFNPASLLAAARFLQANQPRPKVLPEPTALIRNEGRFNGYLEAIYDLIQAASPQAPKTEKRDFQPYAQPNENPNRPS